MLDRLAASHRVVAPDLPGLGGSDAAPSLDAASFGSWMRGTMQAVGVDRPAVVAHSLGGSLVARFAAASPGALARLVLYAAPGIGPYRMPPRLVYSAIRFSLRPTAANAERFDRFLLLDLDATRARHAGWYQAFDELNRERATVKAVKQSMNRLVALGTKRIPDEELRRIDCPVHLIWGRHDRMVPIKTAQRASAAHGWPLEVIEEAAHAPHLEQPEAFLEVVLQTLA
ncbi:MAG TPA: alpha/beta hydrolase [Acidimicrobiales bacterium]|nr:alpha/beta hydrolase [Acidimicrobiales bacterium]